MYTVCIFIEIQVLVATVTERTHLFFVVFNFQTVCSHLIQLCFNV